MKPSWASIAGGSRRLVSPAMRKVSVFAAVAPGLAAGAVVGAAAAAVVGAAAAGAVVGLAAAAAVGGAGAVVGAAAGAPGPHAARRPIPAATPARLRKRRRVNGDDGIDRLPRNIFSRARIT